MLTGGRKIISKTVNNLHIRQAKERNNGVFHKDAPLFNFRIRILGGLLFGAEIPRIDTASILLRMEYIFREKKTGKYCRSWARCVQ